MLTWEELGVLISEMSPTEKKYSVSIFDFSTGEDIPVDEIAFEENGKNLGDDVRPLLVINHNLS